MLILGISAYYHDAAAVLINDETIVAAAQEERFTRKKHDVSFPINAIKYCLKEANISISDLDYIAYYEKPFLKFERLLETYLAEAPFGLRSFINAIPVWIKEKLFLKNRLTKEFLRFGDLDKKSIYNILRFSEHHQSHAASAFFPSPFEEAAILTMDGVGEWTTSSIAYGNKNNIQIHEEIKFPHSLGLLYSAFTYYTGFKVNSGEYKVMGLAPYGKPKYAKLIKEHLIDIKPDGSFRLNMDCFNYTKGLTMTNRKFNKLFGGKPRKKETLLTQKEMDLANSIQVVIEEVLLKIVWHLKSIFNTKNLCLAGGVALNCVANGKIVKERIFENVWIQPAAGDAGGALGAAYSLHYQELKNKRIIDKNQMDKMQGSYLGPSFTNKEVQQYLDKFKAVYQKIDKEDELLDMAAINLKAGKVIGWHQGKMEFGPRALGNRSIIGDARKKEMQTTMNLKIKYRESFRPFAPSVLREKVQDYFEFKSDSPYMLFVAKVKDQLCHKMTEEQQNLFGLEKLHISRSIIPAITHIDYSARIQTVHKETNPRYHKLLSRFYEKTGCAVIVNTSFNVRGEPIVCTPEDSYKCFMRTKMDVLVIEDFILFKTQQPRLEEQMSWQKEFVLD